MHSSLAYPRPFPPFPLLRLGFVRLSAKWCIKEDSIKVFFMSLFTVMLKAYYSAEWHDSAVEETLQLVPLGAFPMHGLL